MVPSMLREIIDEHLPFEINMLRSLYRLLSQIKPPLIPTDQNVQYFAQIEAFCVHARSLLDFFGRKRTTAADAIALNFAPTYQPPFDLDTEPLKSLRTMLNKQVFHLTSKRTRADNNKFVPTGGLERVMRTIEAAIPDFVACLEPKFRHFKCQVPAIDFTITPPPSVVPINDIFSARRAV